ncbi:MAG: coenzyme F420-0:L-glutamate ligase [Gammaproteobacteria bacterium]|nr:coenzyme F420-0:L-glutamate ligase [Gammaproteobacteria bacterium]
MSASNQNEHVSLIALQDFPLVHSRDDIGSLIVEGIVAVNQPVHDGLVIVIAQKIISKAEGRAVRLASVTAGNEALLLAEKSGKDARLVELILSESREIIRQSDNLIITETNLGIIMANAGIDQSNIDEGYALLLPEDPDDSARIIGKQVSEALGIEVGIVIADSVGRPWRKGVVGIAIGAYGIPAVLDLKGSVDLNGRELQATEVGVADSIAAAATLLMGQGSEGNPVILLSGLSYDPSTTVASDILRGKDSDLFR